MEEKPDIFPCSAFRSFVFDEYQSTLIPRGLLCPDKFLVTRLWFNDLSADCSRKESIHENAKCLDFQFHNLKFRQERYFWPFMLLQPLTYMWKKQLKAAFIEHLKENYGSNESIYFSYHHTKFSQLKSFFLLYCVIFTVLSTM